MSRVVVIEMGDDLLQRASYHNQARVHRGYHYPRSLMTALRSRLNYPRFVEDFADCVYDEFDQYYAVGRKLSKVSAGQYRNFMNRIGAPMREAPAEVRDLFESKLIEAVFAVTECAFDPVRLKQCLRARLEEAGVEVRLCTQARRVMPDAGGTLTLECESSDGEALEPVRGSWIFNCTYSQLNGLLENSGLAPIPIKQELTEMALVEMPAGLRNIGLTVMCGPFFSTMPFPPLGCHTLSHVRYTPHAHWRERPGARFDPYEYLAAHARKTHFPMMIQDARRYVPMLAECRQKGSLWEIKTLLPQSELDDGRPILFQRTAEHPNLICVMGGKIDNIYDLPHELKKTGIEVHDPKR